MTILFDLLKFLLIVVPLLLGVAFLTLLERKIMAAIQIRRGPNFVGYGFLQPFADGLKLLIKESFLPIKSNKGIFLFSSFFSLFLTITSSLFLILEESRYVSFSLSILFFLAISSLAVYGIILAGWSSNSRYAFLGSLRSSAQMISYELVLGLLFLCVCFLSQSFHFGEIIHHQKALSFVFPLFPFFLIFFISVLAETNRAPFDLPEAEAELVAGFNVEYASAPFAFFFIAEYGNILIWSNLLVLLFLGGWKSLFFLPAFFSFFLKLFFILFSFCWVRAAFPRYRWDQLMYLTWRVFLPVSLILILFLFSLGWF